MPLYIYINASLHKHPDELTYTHYLFKHGVELCNNIRVVWFA